MAASHVLIIFFNFIFLSKCTFHVDDSILSLFEPFKNVASLPKNSAFSDEEISRIKEEYAIGLKNEDVYLNGTQLIEKYGYDFEEHHVTTSDGYVLTLYRIPGSGRPVFLMHGLLSSFVDWLTAGPDKGLAYVLAAAGYDVWMGNARGNTFSKKHVRLSTSDSKFWDFSWDEIGRFDLPAMIDYVLKTTENDKLTYVGHSQGTTSFFVMCSERPEYNGKIDLMIALSAVAWMKHTTSPLIQILSPVGPFIKVAAKAFGVDEFLPDNDLKEAVTHTFCGDSVLAPIICENIVFLICGFDYSQIDYKQSPVFFNHFPAGCAVKQLLHYAQQVVSGDFKRYDYGVVKNLAEYNSPTPPSYPVDKITVPIAIFYSYGDWLSNPVDVEVLRGKLQNVVEYYEIPLKTFNHLDFLWAKDVKSFLYDRVLELISEDNKTKLQC